MRSIQTNLNLIAENVQEKKIEPISSDRRRDPSAGSGLSASGIAIVGIDNKIKWNENSIMQKTDGR
jgi:hypothetical protein